LSKNSISEAFSIFLSPVLWTADEYDKGTLSNRDLDKLVKILFLDVLFREYQEDDFFSKIFEKFTLTEEFFETQWKLNRISIEMSVEDAINDAIISKSIDSIFPTGNINIDQILKERISKNAPLTP
jgi:hypothetical protein